MQSLPVFYFFQKKAFTGVEFIVELLQKFQKIRKNEPATKSFF